MRRGPASALGAIGIGATLVTLVVASFVVPRTTPQDPATSAVSPRVSPLARGLAPDATIASLDGAPDGSATSVLVVAVSPTPTSVMTESPMPTIAATESPTASAPTVPPSTPAPTPVPTVAPPTPAPTPLPAPATIAPATSTVAAEQRMLDLMNASRVAGGLVPLTMDAVVVETARAHSAAEAAVRYVYHDGPDGTAHDRDSAACGTGWYGENTGKVWNDNVDALHVEFMNEPWEPINHRTNIMDPNFRRVGVGAVVGPDALYMTMVFCR